MLKGDKWGEVSVFFLSHFVQFSDLSAGHAVTRYKHSFALIQYLFEHLELETNYTPRHASTLCEYIYPSL